MKKIYTSLCCPYCNGEHGNNVTCKAEDKIEKDENERRTIVTIKRDYNCYCDDCKKGYTVDYGKAQLIRYYPFTTPANDDIKLFVDYESEFDRSYRITEVKGIPMVIMEDDPDPIIISNDQKEELIDNHTETKNLTYDIWMHRHR